MKKDKTAQKRKQRKRLFNAPKHKRKKDMSVSLEATLKKKYGKRNTPIRKGDKVKVLRGNYKGHTDEVTKVNTKAYKVYVKGVVNKKSNGEDVERPVHPSNLMITELNTEDAKRVKALTR